MARNVYELKVLGSPETENSRIIREKVEKLKDCILAKENAHFKYVAEVYVNDEKEKAHIEYLNALDNADKVLFPGDPVLDTLMASIDEALELENKQDQEILLYSLSDEETDEVIHENKEIPEKCLESSDETTEDSCEHSTSYEIIITANIMEESNVEALFECENL